MRGLETIIAEHPLFADLEAETSKFIAECASNVVFEAGDRIAKEGQDADHFYLIREGKVAVELFAPNQGAIILQTVGPDDILGWSWLFPPYKWCFDVKALERTRAIAMDGRCLRKKCEGDHDLGYKLMKKFSEFMVRRLQATRMQILDIYQTPPA